MQSRAHRGDDRRDNALAHALDILAEGLQKVGVAQRGVVLGIRLLLDRVGVRVGRFSRLRLAEPLEHLSSEHSEVPLKARRCQRA